MLSEAKIYTALAIALLSATAIAPPSRAQSTTTFVCATSNGSLATIARTSQNREIPLILWNSPNIVPTADSPQKRCDDVSSRLQTYYNNGTFKYITTRRMNGQTVACVVQQNDDNASCSGEPLFALNLPPESRPGDTLQSIFRVRVASAGPISETATPVYISLDKVLNGEYAPMRRSSSRPQPSNTSP